MARLILIAVLLAMVGVGLRVGWGTAYEAGANSERTRQADAIAANQAAEAVKVETLIQWRDRERIIYRDRIQAIHTAADPTGCLDTDLRDAGLGFMLPTTTTPDNH